MGAANDRLRLASSTSQHRALAAGAQNLANPLGGLTRLAGNELTQSLCGIVYFHQLELGVGRSGRWLARVLSSKPIDRIAQRRLSRARIEAEFLSRSLMGKVHMLPCQSYAAHSYQRFPRPPDASPAFG